MLFQMQAEDIRTRYKKEGAHPICTPSFININYVFIFDDDVYPLHSHLHPIYRAILVEGKFLLPFPIRKKGERTICYVPLANKTNGSCLALARHDTSPTHRAVLTPHGGIVSLMKKSPQELSLLRELISQLLDST